MSKIFGETLAQKPEDIINIMIGTIVFFVALARVVTLLADKLGKRGANHA